VTRSIDRSGAAPDPEHAARAARSWWDAAAGQYQAEHGDFLGPARFRWGPEGLDESTARLLGDVSGRRVLEVGAGAAQCARWLGHQGAAVTAIDISIGQLLESAALDAGTGTPVVALQADAAALPFGAASFDLACSSYGALPFAADLVAVHSEVARVLSSGGRWVYSVTHPIRWAFPDDPGPRGLTATRSYFDRTPYLERAGDGAVSYAEFHRTIGDHVRSLVHAGFRLIDLVEPEWPEGHEQVWGGWSPLRGRLIPGTAVFVTERAPTRGS
jgi:SAM-dependent methyltransferase